LVDGSEQQEIENEDVTAQDVHMASSSDNEEKNGQPRNVAMPGCDDVMSISTSDERHQENLKKMLQKVRQSVQKGILRPKKQSPMCMALNHSRKVSLLRRNGVAN